MKRFRTVALVLGVVILLGLLAACASRPSTPPVAFTKPVAPKPAIRVQKLTPGQLAVLAAVPAGAKVKGTKCEALLTSADVEQATGLEGLSAGPSG